MTPEDEAKLHKEYLYRWRGTQAKRITIYIMVIQTIIMAIILVLYIGWSVLFKEVVVRRLEKA